MRLIFDHTYGFGKMSKQSFAYVPFAAVLEPTEYKNSLENGWFPLSDEVWYQTRSTRIDLKFYKPTKNVLKLSKKVKHFSSVRLTKDKRIIFEKIYEDYMKHRRFRHDLTFDDIVSNSHGYNYYVYEDAIVAFSFYKVISDSLLGIEFAWNYSNPKLSLGHVNIYYTSLFAKFKKCKYIYLSSGYESCSIYKSSYPGFQWWKGYEWSSDVEQYVSLCKRDDRAIIKVDELI